MGKFPLKLRGWVRAITLLAVPFIFLTSSFQNCAPHRFESTSGSADGGSTPTPGGGSGGGAAASPSKPTGSIQIENGAAFTNALSVTLNLSTELGEEMYITNESTCLKGGVWEAFSAIKDWSLLNSNGANSVFVIFRNGDGVSECMQASIVHDNSMLVAITSAPSGTIDTATAATVRFSIPDPAAKNLLCKLNGAPVACAIGTNLKLGLLTVGNYTIVISAEDAAGNLGQDQRSWSVALAAPVPTPAEKAIADCSTDDAWFAGKIQNEFTNRSGQFIAPTSSNQNPPQALSLRGGSISQLGGFSVAYHRFWDQISITNVHSATGATLHFYDVRNLGTLTEDVGAGASFFMGSSAANMKATTVNLRNGLFSYKANIQTVNGQGIFYGNRIHSSTLGSVSNLAGGGRVCNSTIGSLSNFSNGLIVVNATITTLENVSGGLTLVNSKITNLKNISGGLNIYGNTTISNLTNASGGMRVWDSSAIGTSSNISGGLGLHNNAKMTTTSFVSLGMVLNDASSAMTLSNIDGGLSLYQTSHVGSVDIVKGGLVLNDQCTIGSYTNVDSFYDHRP